MDRLPPRRVLILNLQKFHQTRHKTCHSYFQAKALRGSSHLAEQPHLPIYPPPAIHQTILTNHKNHHFLVRFSSAKLHKAKSCAECHLCRSNGLTDILGPKMKSTPEDANLCSRFGLPTASLYLLLISIHDEFQTSVSWTTPSASSTPLLLRHRE